MLDASIDDKALTRAIGVLKATDSILAPEFARAGQQTIDYVIKDLQRGVGEISGQLKQSIMGELKSVVGVQSESLFRSATTPYDYAARLDHDGRMRWRSGKYRGYRTFGWWTSVIPKLIRNQAKKYYTKAVERGVVTVAARITK